MRSNIMNRQGVFLITTVRIFILFSILLFCACSGGSGGSDTSPSDNTNNPPQVNAGADQVISLPTDTIQLNATATDDGLPAGSTLTYAWIQESGPENATFSETDILQTSVTFVNTGSYVFQLTVSDGELSTSDTVTITVNEEGSEPDPIDEIPRSVSRTSGVAPLSVHFTAGLNSSTLENRPFHDREYSWDFGDSGSGNWNTSGISKNNAKGAVTTHVFEDPGTYTVSLKIRDISGIIDTDTFTITVSDPDIVYSGTNTICVSDTASNDFTGKPIGALEIVTDDLSTISNYITDGKRILFRRDSSWNSGTLNTPDITGPFTMGAFGSGNNPEITIIDGSKWIELTKKQDCRFMDLTLLDPTRTHGTFSGDYNMQRILFLRLNIIGFDVGLGWTHWNIPDLMTIDQMVVMDCEISDCYKNGMYVGGERIALLGNIIKNIQLSHVVRIWQGYQATISHNELSGSSINSDLGRLALKLHGPGISDSGTVYWGEPISGTPILANQTKFVIISNNLFGSSGPFPVSMGGQNAASDERLFDIIFERNKLIADYGEKNTFNVQQHLSIMARFVSIRNNLFDANGAHTSYAAISLINSELFPNPIGIYIYNNTIYRNDNDVGSWRYGIVVNEGISNIVIKNNLISFPEVGEQTEMIGIVNLGTSISINNNLITDTPNFANPDNSDPLSRDFSLSPSSAAIDQGTDVPVFEDFDGTERPVSNYDIGAFEY